MPTLIAATPGRVAPEPRLLAAPSPIAGNHGTPSNSGNFLTCAATIFPGASETGLSRDAVIPHFRNNAASQRSVRPSSSPVPLAIAKETFAAPHHSSWIHSAGETHRATRRNSAGSAFFSQMSFAGQNDARAMQPVRACIAVSPGFFRSAAAASRHRESAHVKTGVIARPFASSPSKLCQKQETPIPARAPRAFALRQAAKVFSSTPETARRKSSGRNSARPPAPVISGYATCAVVSSNRSPRAS